MKVFFFRSKLILDKRQLWANQFHTLLWLNRVKIAPLLEEAQQILFKKNTKKIQLSVGSTWDIVNCSRHRVAFPSYSILGNNMLDISFFGVHSTYSVTRDDNFRVLHSALHVIPPGIFYLCPDLLGIVLCLVSFHLVQGNVSCTHQMNTNSYRSLPT